MNLTKCLTGVALAGALGLAAGTAQATDIKFGIGIPEGDFPEYNALVRFKEYVEFKSNGDMTVRLFPNNQLGGEREMIEQVQQGSLELSFPADGAMAGYYPKMQVWSIPYLFESAPVAWKVINGEFAREMQADILEQTGIRALAFSQNGFRSFTNNVRPIVNPGDISGLKIRTMESPVFMELVNSLGATATPISGAEVLLSLRQGVVDGQENPPAVVYGGGLGEVQKYYTLNEHVFGLHVIIANNEWFEALEPGEQQIIVDAAQLMAWTENLQKTEGDWRFSEKLADELGMEIHVSTPDEKAAFKELTQAPVTKFIEENVGEEVVGELLSAVDAAKAELYGTASK
ncbi:DctP family TRAP transporter solute-binding subunit [Acuticoccus sp. MNP-M23]|uniref:DctP family TRAP transporter solute-binding subunit n=1 Tax=Acuticoccus sp. MNP-M23 TaxID=3072793 RepID=UPI0028169CA6|nr:DctP family TRAP transporter solute-binding subunit [Acuticoccus sp. MNP-M23]WMS40947.1 DctP family TRAP transporter solute-binding subunit [Acuticoccus sp. MNP-M23]